MAPWDADYPTARPIATKRGAPGVVGPHLGASCVCACPSPLLRWIFSPTEGLREYDPPRRKLTTFATRTRPDEAAPQGRSNISTRGCFPVRGVSHRAIGLITTHITTLLLTLLLPLQHARRPGQERRVLLRSTCTRPIGSDGHRAPAHGPRNHIGHPRKTQTTHDARFHARRAATPTTRGWTLVARAHLGAALRTEKAPLGRPHWAPEWRRRGAARAPLVRRARLPHRSRNAQAPSGNRRLRAALESAARKRSHTSRWACFPSRGSASSGARVAPQRKRGARATAPGRRPGGARAAHRSVAPERRGNLEQEPRASGATTAPEKRPMAAPRGAYRGRASRAPSWRRSRAPLLRLEAAAPFPQRSGAAPPLSLARRSGASRAPLGAGTSVARRSGADRPTLGRCLGAARARFSGALTCRRWDAADRPTLGRCSGEAVTRLGAVVAPLARRWGAARMQLGRLPSAVLAPLARRSGATGAPLGAFAPLARPTGAHRRAAPARCSRRSVALKAMHGRRRHPWSKPRVCSGSSSAAPTATCATPPPARGPPTATAPEHGGARPRPRSSAGWPG